MQSVSAYDAVKTACTHDVVCLASLPLTDSRSSHVMRGGTLTNKHENVLCVTCHRPVKDKKKENSILIKKLEQEVQEKLNLVSDYYGCSQIFANSNVTGVIVQAVLGSYFSLPLAAYMYVRAVPCMCVYVCSFVTWRIRTRT